MTVGNRLQTGFNPRSEVYIDCLWAITQSLWAAAWEA
jgi:hypothetical protein